MMDKNMEDQEDNIEESSVFESVETDNTQPIYQLKSERSVLLKFKKK